jgi:16S rRNA (guanine527-N7)-methyltransferase
VTSDEAWIEILVDVWRDGQRRSMVGPGDPRTHLEHARALTSYLDPPDRALDLGSGAGIPGLALAGLWPASRWSLLDAALRRVRFLQDAVDALNWADRVAVIHGRAEDAGRDAELRGTFDLVTSRSFGPPAAAAECGAPFVRPAGILAVTEPPNASGQRWPPEGLAALSLEPLPAVPGLQRFRSTAPVDARFPRRAGVPQNRPLF